MRSRREWASALHPEEELVLLCARTRLDAGKAVRIRELLRGELNWFYLLEVAIRHGVVSLLYWQLRAVCPETVPQTWMDFSRQLFESTGRRNLNLAAQLFRILEVFETNGILAVPYKGPTLTALAYGNLALREFVDLDILVRAQDALRACELLASEGYQPEFRWWETQSVSSGRIPGQYFFIRNRDRCIVELHTCRTLRYFPVPLDLEPLSQRLQLVTLCGREVRTFSVEDSLSILCVHASKHFWDRLMWVCDISELVQNSPGLNWKHAEEQARRLGCERMLFLGLYLAHNILEAPLPEDILRRVEASSVVRSLATQVRERLFQRAGALPGAAQRFFFRFRMQEKPWDGIRYCLRLALSPTEEDWALVRLPAPLAPLYSALRPLRLIRKYGLGMVRRPEPDLSPFVPTPAEVIERMLALAEVSAGDTVYDLGCGDGRIVVTAAKRFGARAVGVDIDPRRIREARARARAEGVEHLVRFVQQDAKTLDVSEATVVTLYLTLAGNIQLAQMLQQQLRCGARVLSRDFELPGWPPEKSEQVEIPGGLRTALYLWRIGSQFNRPVLDQGLVPAHAPRANAAGQ